MKGYLESRAVLEKSELSHALTIEWHGQNHIGLFGLWSRSDLFSVCTVNAIGCIAKFSDSAETGEVIA